MMRMKTTRARPFAWVVLGVLTLTATAVWAEMPGKPTLRPPEALSKKPDLQKLQPARRMPDLTIRTFGLKEWGRCEPGKMMFQFQVDVANGGMAASPAGVKLEVKDQHGVGWGNHAALGAIPPGGHQVVTVPISYFSGDPQHMKTANPHPFQAKVDPGNTQAEADEGNNESLVVRVDVGKLCSGGAVDLKIRRVFVVTVLPGIEYSGAHVPEFPVNTPFDLCCEFAIENAASPLPEDWKIGLFLDGALQVSVRGNDYSQTGHMCYPGGRLTV
ncbi:MAG: hypothetical protein MUF69_09030, partial [Desulfobacterota bacterium]|nr:hypothetical protein [Thermodesulfobacteriota bacterium]